MKTTILFIAALVAATIITAQTRNCASDSLQNAIHTTIQMDEAPPPCYPFECYAPDACHAIQMQDSFVGVLDFGGSGQYFQVIVLDNCHLVVKDTCVRIGTQTPSFVLFNTFPNRSTLLVCGQSGTSVTIFPKVTPSMSYPAFAAPTIDLDTLCGPFVGIPQPIPHPRQYWEFDGTYWRPVDAMKPNGLYKVRE